MVSDLTYVRAGKKWNYVCVLIDLFHREIIRYRAGKHKNAELVKQASMTVEGNLDIHIFHTDRGNEFKSKRIAEYIHPLVINPLCNIGKITLKKLSKKY
ncbi:MAG: DDE-type integrase/transposase/recombinase [Lachnospiraceae bacterium]|nr:DDE-type integrase/transposase/recombinase [Lachnospiraceae bacterium]